MQALVKYNKGKGFIEVRDVNMPVIGPNDVLIEIKACGVCGTDLHIYHDSYPYWPPVILGHEFSGVIHEAGSAVKDWHVGDRIVGEPHTLACGKCYLCRTGNPQICSDKRSPGWGIDGGFAPFMRFPDPKLLHRIPESLSFEEAALTEPLANVITDIVLNHSVTAGDFVVVSGPGAIGIMSALVAKYCGAGTVMIIGTNTDEALRLELCRNLKLIDQVMNIQKDNVTEIVQDFTHGKGADLFIEASGAPAAINMGANILKKQGCFAGIGLTGHDYIQFPYDLFMKKNLHVTYNISTKYESWDRALDILVKGIIPVNQLITHRENINNWENVFSELEQGKGIKGMFIF